jgi:hypothetical protein
MKDAAENSQALRDSARAAVDLRDAIATGASGSDLAELTDVSKAADDRVVSLRRRQA